jgi:hypothetical protein
MNYQDIIDQLEDTKRSKDLDETVTNVDKIRLAQELLQASIEIMEGVAEETNDGHAKAYMVDQLKILVSENHGFLSRDYNLDKWIEKLERMDEEEDEEEDE